MRRFIIFLVLASAAVIMPIAQSIVTADQVFTKVADTYSGIADFEANITITSSRSIDTGKISYKSPSYVRIDYSSPAGQVIWFDGATLMIYVPSYRAIFKQTVAGSAPGVGLVGKEGLRILRRNFSVSFESSPSPVTVSGLGSVYRLVLTRKTTAEGYKQIILSVDPDSLLIKRFEATGIGGDVTVFDYSGIMVNQGIPATRFIFDPPADANVFDDFLLKSD